MENTREIIMVTRGRPRKPKPIEEINEDTVDKRGRGRPRKYPKQEEKPKKEIYVLMHLVPRPPSRGFGPRCNMPGATQ